MRQENNEEDFQFFVDDLMYVFMWKKNYPPKKNTIHAIERWMLEREFDKFLQHVALCCWTINKLQ